MADEIPEDIAAAIQECWPDGVVVEFDPAESYFHQVRPALERDLQRIPGAALRWQTQPQEQEDWQSYHVYFLALEGTEFEAQSSEDPQTAAPGQGWYGLAVCVSLAASIAAADPEEYSQFEDGSETIPDIVTSAYDEDTGEPVDLWAHYRELLDEETFARLDDLYGKIAAILEKHQLALLDRPVLDAPVPALGVDESLALEPPISVRDAFFFHGA